MPVSVSGLKHYHDTILGNMPNLRGGKSYKKAKGGTSESDTSAAFLKKESDQMVGRILRLLGDLNASVFCQDNKTRICKIAMGIKKKVRFFVGDIILISLRDCLLSKLDLEAGKRSDRGDILGKYSEQQYGELKAEGVPLHLFAQADLINKISVKFEQGDTKGALALGEDGLENYVFEHAEECSNSLVAPSGDNTKTKEDNEDIDIDIL